MRSFSVDGLAVRMHDDLPALAADAADIAQAAIGAAVEARGEARVMFASGNSQLAFLAALTSRSSVPWPHVVGFHMDEYVGVDRAHPASFARYMRDRIADRVPIGAFHYLAGDAIDPRSEAVRYAALLDAAPIDLCCLGIGENGHLAFNDPPPGGADFDDREVAKIVTLDEGCRVQQVGEGHFDRLADVPPTAITVTVPALLAARRVLAIVPEARKAGAVAAALRGAVGEACPASALRRCAHAVLLVDRDSARGIA